MCGKQKYKVTKEHKIIKKFKEKQQNHKNPVKSLVNKFRNKRNGDVFRYRKEYVNIFPILK